MAARKKDANEKSVARIKDLQPECLKVGFWYQKPDEQQQGVGV